MRMTTIVVLAVWVYAASAIPHAQERPAPQKPAVKGMEATPESIAQITVYHTVKQFLDDLGHRRLDKLPAMFAPKATLTILRQSRQGPWVNSHQTVEEWLAGLRAQKPGTIFEEPLTNITTTVESLVLAHLRADFTVVSEGQVRSHGVDYFTLVKDGETWKIASAAYTSIPGPPR